MIISDFAHHKIDLSFSKDSYIKLTSFHTKGDAWIVKTISLSPDAYNKMLFQVKIHLEEEREKRKEQIK